MSKIAIDRKILSEIIQKCVENRLNEAFAEEGVMNSLGKAAAWAGNKIKQGANWVGKQINGFKDGYSVNSSNGNTSQVGNGNVPQYQNTEDGPKPFPGLTAQGENQKSSQKQYSSKEVTDMWNKMTNFRKAAQKEGYVYDSKKKKFISGPDATKLRSLNSQLTRLRNKWYNASEFSKKMNEITYKVTKDVIREIRKLQ